MSTAPAGELVKSYRKAGGAGKTRLRSRSNEDHPPGEAAQAEVGTREVSLIRRALVEALGTCLLTLVAGGIEMTATLRPGEVDLVAKALGPGLLIMAMIYAFGDVSGAHFNPIVTLAFTLRGVFERRLVPLYWLAQLLGAVAGAGLLRALFGTVAHGGANQLHVSVGRGLVLEAMLTLILVTVILNTASRHRVVGSDAALAVGFTIVVCGLFGEPLSGASMNPARSLGPVIVTSAWTNAWVYAVGPLIGAVIAVAASYISHPHRNPEEPAAARGDGQQ